MSMGIGCRSGVQGSCSPAFTKLFCQLDLSALTRPQLHLSHCIGCPPFCSHFCSSLTSQLGAASLRNPFLAHWQAELGAFQEPRWCLCLTFCAGLLEDREAHLCSKHGVYHPVSGLGEYRIDLQGASQAQIVPGTQQHVEGLR